MPIKEITVEEAKALLDSAPSEYTYIDVRSLPEFAAGHPRGAKSVPIFHVNAATREMEPNLDFLGVIRANFPPGAKLLIGCQMGGRSRRAAEELAAAGYSGVCNVMGGFGGARDPSGRTIAKGWRELGYPTEQEDSEGAGYASLRNKVK
ncbi:MAG: rhodanese-like domain-containing protein [Vicinamibacteria bacterium]